MKDATQVNTPPPAAPKADRQTAVAFVTSFLIGKAAQASQLLYQTWRYGKGDEPPSPALTRAAFALAGEIGELIEALEMLERGRADGEVFADLRAILAAVDALPEEGPRQGLLRPVMPDGTAP